MANTISKIQVSGVTYDIVDESKLVNKTYSDLVTLKNEGELVVGAMYRITDYVTTTTQANTHSANHAFDIIVTATDVDTLNENAMVIKHEGDTYFTNSDLNAWEIKYDINNDTTKYAWADSTNGKGVIYYMKDEWGNEAPYDFKNIMFKRKYITAAKHPNTAETSTTSWGIVNKWCAYTNLTASTISPSNVTATTEGWLYTFTKLSSTASTATVTDYSIAANGSGMKYCYENKIELFADGSGTKRKVFLNNIVIVANGTTDQEYDNTFGANCRNITLYNNNYGNTFGTNNYNMTFGNYCCYNTFGNYCCYNTFGNECNYNSFGNYYCAYNSFGNSCQYNSFGNSCQYNSFGNYCADNSFGDSCQYNSFGNSCQYNSFGNYCQHINVLKDYFYYNIVESGNEYIDITSTQTTSSSNTLRNITIAQGVNTDGTNKKTISHNTVKDTFKTTYQASASAVVNV